MTGAGDRDGTEADDETSGASTESGLEDSRENATDTPGEEGPTESRGGAPDERATDRQADRAPRDGGVDTNPQAVASSTDAGASTSIDPVSLGEPQGLDPAVRYYWIVGSAFAAIPLTALVAVLALTLNGLVTPLPVVPIVAAVFVLALVLGGVRSVLRYRSWEYVVREESLLLSRGVVTHVRTVVPYVRVQHIDTRRGAVERVFGLASLVVYTAGSRGADVTVPGLTPERASALQTRLKRLAIESEEEDAV